MIFDWDLLAACQQNSSRYSKTDMCFFQFLLEFHFLWKKKTFKNFIVEIRLKIILKLEGGLVLDLSVIEYFPGFGE